jgi:acyl carrier protein
LETPCELPDENEIQSWIIERLAVRLDTPAADIDPKRPFSAYGMDSMNALKLAGELEDWLDVELPATLVWDFPTVEQMAYHLADYVHNPASAETVPTDFEFQP